VLKCEYIGAFLTLRCNLNCSYCINRQADFKVPEEMSADDWIKGLGRLVTRNDLPITLCGGEPTQHPEFYKIVKGLRGRYMDLLTNGLFSTPKFTKEISPDIFKRNAPYASIRFSYHRNTNPSILVSKVRGLMLKGYSVGIWGLQHPDMENKNKVMKNICKGLDIDYREKEFLDATHGTYKYPDAVNGKEKKHVKCKTTEILIGPSGHLFRCHADLYANRNQYGHILDERITLPDFIDCNNFGSCSACDVKIKTDRYQVYGRTSVEIKEC